MGCKNKVVFPQWCLILDMIYFQGGQLQTIFGHFTKNNFWKGMADYIIAWTVICKASILRGFRVPTTLVLTKQISLVKWLFSGGFDTQQKCHLALALKTTNLIFIRAFKWGSMYLLKTKGVPNHLHYYFIKTWKIIQFPWNDLE